MVSMLFFMSLLIWLSGVVLAVWVAKRLAPCE